MVVRRWLVASAAMLVACAGAAPVPRTEVAVAPPPPDTTAAPPTACTIAGDGEFRANGWSHAPFVVQRERTGDDPIAVVTSTSDVGVAWSQLPSAVLPSGARAHVALGAGHEPAAKIGGWAPLQDRVFQLRAEATVVTGHVWVVGGIDVQVRGMRDGSVVVTRAQSGVVEPEKLEATARCADVVWMRDRVEPEPGLVLAPATLQARGGAIDLSATPGGATVQRIVVRPRERFPLTELGRAPGSVRVAAYAGVLRFDGWVVEGQTEPLGPPGVGRLGGSHLTRPPVVRMGRAMVAAKETPLYLGKTATDAKPIGTLEVGAKLDVVGTGGRAELRFAPRLLDAPEGLAFFADDADLVPL